MKIFYLSGIVLPKKSKHYQIFRIMRTTAYFLALFTSLAFAENVSSQNARVDLMKQQTKIKEVLDEIEQQTDYLFISNRDINLDRKVSIQAVHTPVRDILNEILKDTGIDYVMEGINIILTKKSDIRQQGIVVSGVVYDSDGQPMPGVNVVVKETITGVVTDANGKYSINVPDRTTVLVFSFVGYATQEIPVENRNTIDVALSEGAQAIEEVVVVVYVTKRKETLTGNVTKSKSKVLTNRPLSSPANALQGVAVGLQVMQPSGHPGASSSIKIGERATFSGGTTSPLYVIDGIIRDVSAFDAININDIEDITLLKDASSTAIYGIKGGNGVLMVTTKKGITGKPVINYSNNFTLQDRTYVPKVNDAYTNGMTYRKILMEWYDYDQSIAEADFDWYTDEELEWAKTHSYEKEWAKAIWRRNPFAMNHNFSISGGTADFNYYASGGYVQQKGAMNNEYEKYNALIKFDGNITNRLSFSVNINAFWEKSSRPNSAWNGAKDLHGLISAITIVPIQPPYINGIPVENYTYANPASLIDGDGGYRKDAFSTVTPIVELKYKLPYIEGLTAKGRFAYTSKSEYGKEFRYAPMWGWFEERGEHNHILTDKLLDLRPSIGQINGNGGTRERLITDYRRRSNYQLNVALEYKKSFGLHNFLVYAGYEQMSSRGDWANITADGFDLFEYSEIQGSQGLTDEKKRWINGTQDNLFGQASYIGSFDYNYDLKYMISAVLRIDGSYIFPPQNRWGYFPAISGAWNIAKEGFFEPFTDYASTFKIRASYGLTGSDNTAPWQWQQTYPYSVSSGIIFDDVLSRSMGLGGSVNKNITWEKNYKTGIGVDIAMPSNLVSFTFDYLYKKTTDILGTRLASVPSTVGANLPAVNYGKASSRIFELTLGHENRVGEFHYMINANWSIMSNKYLEIDQAATVRDYENKLGKPIDGQIWGYRSEGIIRTQADLDRIYEENGPNFTIFGLKPALGMLMYKDLRGPLGTDEPDGKVDGYDIDLISTKGSPRIIYGLNMAADWKGFDINLIFSGFAGYDAFLTDETTRRAPSAWALPTWWNDMYTRDNINAEYPNAAWIDWRKGSNIQHNSTFWLKNRSFIRCKSLAIGYTLPANVSQAIGIRNLRVYLSGENLFYINTGNWKYSDPEISEWRSYPILRSYSVGLNISI